MAHIFSIPQRGHLLKQNKYDAAEAEILYKYKINGFWVVPFNRNAYYLIRNI